MSSRGKHVCVYCKRDNFKSHYGLTNHQKFGSCHDAMVREMRERAGAPKPRDLRPREPHNRGHDGSESGEESSDSEEEESESEDGAVAMQDDEASNSEDGSSVASEHSSMPSILSSASSSSSSEGSGGSSAAEEGDELPIPKEVFVDEPEGPIRSITGFLHFRRRCQSPG